MGEPDGREIGRGKRLLFSAILVVLMLGFFEVVARVFLATQVGASVLWFGTSLARHSVGGDVDDQGTLARNLYHRGMRGAGDENHNIRQHDYDAGGYSKYYPNQQRVTYDADTGELYPVHINASGFRGEDFAETKAPGSVRIVTLGASSTFGYHDRDDETYPEHLERVLVERCGDEHPYEVINLGIPHLTSEQIVALFLAEGVPLGPDVVTFYEAINDSSDEEEEGGGGDGKAHKKSPLKRATRWARDHLLLAALADELLSAGVKRYDAAQVAAHQVGKAEHFIANLERLREECERRGILLVIGKQQARSLMLSRDEIRGMTYAEEISRVERKLAEEGWVAKKELNFLTHDRLTRAQEAWAREKGVAFADVMAALDRDRDVLVSWVHLNHRGNRMVAEALAAPILERTCGAAVQRAAAD